MLATLVLGSVLLQTQQPKVKVFILAGQSNMEGKGMPAPLAWQVGQPQYQARWKSFIRNGDFEAFTRDYQASIAKDPKDPVYDWAERDDVWVDFHERHGNLTVAYSDRKNAFGPEVTFGQVMGDRYKEPVLLIKTAWGGKAIAREFLPPSERDSEAKWEAIAKNENKTVEEVKKTHGEFYDLMVKEIDDALSNIKQNHPAYQGQGYQIEGFVWFQGFNDQFGPGYPDAYLHNMTVFINDVRKRYGDVPFVIGQMGQDADKNGVYPVDKNGELTAAGKIRKAQTEVAELPQFKGNVVCVRTAPLYDTEADAIYSGPGGWQADVEKWRHFGDDKAYHYLGSPLFFARAGTAFAQAMLKMLGT